MTAPERLWAYVVTEPGYEGIIAERTLEALAGDRPDCASLPAEYVLASVAAAAVETERQRTWAGTVGEGKKMLDDAMAINTALRAERDTLRGRVEALRLALGSIRHDAQEPVDEFESFIDGIDEVAKEALSTDAALAAKGVPNV